MATDAGPVTAWPDSRSVAAIEGAAIATCGEAIATTARLALRSFRLRLQLDQAARNEKTSSQKPVDLLTQLCRLERLLDRLPVQMGDKRLRLFSECPPVMNMILAA